MYHFHFSVAYSTIFYDMYGYIFLFSEAFNYHFKHCWLNVHGNMKHMNLMRVGKILYHPEAEPTVLLRKWLSRA